MIAPNPCATLAPLCEELPTCEHFDNCLDEPPFVCPGCYAIGEEPCKPGCIDAEIAAEREERIARDAETDWDDEDCDEGGDWEVVS